MILVEHSHVAYGSWVLDYHQFTNDGIATAGSPVRASNIHLLQLAGEHQQFNSTHSDIAVGYYYYYYYLLRTVVHKSVHNYTT